MAERLPNMRCPRLSDLPAPPAGRTGWPWTEESPRLPETMADGRPWPKVSIVTPSFNQGQFLEEAIRSVLLQGYPNLEYIIIDGVSRDNSVAVIRKYEPWLAWWASEPDNGQADAINKGFRRATGEFLGWLNSDDRLAPGAINSLVTAFLVRPEAELLYGDNECGGENGTPAFVRRGERLPFSDMLRTLRVAVPQPGSLWRRSLLDKVGLLDTRWQVVLDREFFVRAGLRCRMEYLPGVLAFFRRHAASKSMAWQRQWMVEIPRMYTEFFRRSDLPVAVRALRRETVASAYLYCAGHAHRLGSRATATHFVAAALLHYPRVLLRGDADSYLGKGALRVLGGLRRVAQRFRNS